MRIEISRSGGFAGLTRTWTVEVSSSEAEERWVPLVEEAAHRDEDLKNQSPDVQRDRFVYRIVVGYHEATLPESCLGEPLRELLDRAKTAAPGPDPESNREQERPPSP